MQSPSDKASVDRVLKLQVTTAAFASHTKIAFDTSSSANKANHTIQKTTNTIGVNPDGINVRRIANRSKICELYLRKTEPCPFNENYLLVMPLPA
jgi:hypothetical protein